MSPEQIMALQRLRLFSFGRMFIPISISRRYVHKGGITEFEWRELRIFGVLIAMWGTLG